MDDDIPVALDSADGFTDDAPANDDETLVEPSGGQDTIPRHCRELVEAVIFEEVPNDTEEATKGDEVVADNLLVLEAKWF